ncbi:hypothetical protein [Mycobacterium sp. KBS0706]|nr:hypothetical protein [Mycobacterium sp. KBS0706]
MLILKLPWSGGGSLSPASHRSKIDFRVAEKAGIMAGLPLSPLQEDEP